MEFIQSPLTDAPMMPALLGTNGYFVPDSSLSPTPANRTIYDVYLRKR